MKTIFKGYDKIAETLSLVITVINASAAVTLLEQRPEKIFRLSNLGQITFIFTVLGPSLNVPI